MVIIVSHDRVFLDEVSTDSLHISGYARQLTQTRGNYSTWHKRCEQQQLTLGRDMTRTLILTLTLNLTPNLTLTLTQARAATAHFRPGHGRQDA